MLPPVLPPARVMKISSSTAYEAAPARVADPSPPPSSVSDSDDEPAQPLEQEEKAAPSLNISSDYGWEEAPGAEEDAWETIPVKGKAKSACSVLVFPPSLAESLSSTDAEIRFVHLQSHSTTLLPLFPRRPLRPQLLSRPPRPRRPARTLLGQKQRRPPSKTRKPSVCGSSRLTRGVSRRLGLRSCTKRARRTALEAA